MCIEDIAISRRCFAKLTALASDVAAVLKPNPDRLAVLVTTQFTNASQTSIALNAADSAAGRSIVLYRVVTGGAENMIGMGKVFIDYKEFGPLVQGELHVKTNASAGTAVEIVMMPELAADVKKLIKEKGW